MIRNTKDAWGWPALALHWAVALLVIATFTLGLWMSEVPARADRPYYFAIHASLGITLLVVLAARIVWALFNPRPTPPFGTPTWQQAVARLTHLSLYALTFVAVVLGWLLAGTQEPPIEPQAFGVVPLSAPVALGESAEDFLEEAHELAAYALMALVGLHAAAALWHHYFLHDDTLRRMLSGNAASNSPRA
jgi:cytochrome b561